MLSANERFNLIMNGNNIGEGVELTSNIDSILREINAIDNLNDFNNEIDRLLKTFDTINQVESKIEETQLLIDILKSNKLSDTAIKILNTNKLYTNVWNIGTESFTVSTLESKLEIATEGLWNLIKNVGRRIIEWINKFLNRTSYFDKKVDEYADQLSKLTMDDIDIEKIEKKKIKIVDVLSYASNGKKYSDILNKITELTERIKELDDNANKEDVSELNKNFRSYFFKTTDTSKDIFFTPKIKGKLVKEDCEDLIKGKSGTFYTSAKYATDTQNSITNFSKKYKEVLSTALSTEKVQPTLKDKLLLWLSNQLLSFLRKYIFKNMIEVQRSYIKLAVLILQNTKKVEQ